jgi:cytochrome c556
MSKMRKTIRITSFAVGAGADTRTLANMRDHLLSLQEIQAALSKVTQSCVACHASFRLQ